VRQVYNSAETIQCLGYPTVTALCGWHLEEKGLNKFVAPCAGDEYAEWKSKYFDLYYAVDEAFTEEDWNQHWEELVQQARRWPAARNIQLLHKVKKGMESDGHTIQGKHATLQG
jgi:hypothetical protein